MTNPNDSVFPEQWLHQQFSDVIPTLCSKGGLTKREIFAAIAMGGIIHGCYSQPDFSMDWVGDRAVEFADTLIAALNKEGE